MNLDDFLNLKECMMIDRRVEKHLNAINGEKDRVLNLKKMESARSQNLTSLEAKLKEIKAELKNFEAELFNIEKQLAQTTNRIPQLKTENEITKTTQEIELLKSKKSATETLILESLEKEQGTEREISDTKTFLKGIVKTIAEIESESKLLIETETIAIKKLESEIEAIVELLPQNLRTIFHDLNKRFRFKSPLSTIVNGNCKLCGFTVNRQIEQDIETMKIIHHCGSCRRLLTPSKVFHGGLVN